MTDIERAKSFCIYSHFKQVRKYSGMPYWYHPQDVAQYTSLVTDDSDMISAAWLHDTVEDTDVTLDEIDNKFGSRVGQLVGWLTDVSQPSDGNRQARKAIDRAHSADSPGDAQTIKCFDMTSNTLDIALWDRGFAKVYLDEKTKLLQLLTNADKRALDIAWSAVNFASNLITK